MTLAGTELNRSGSEIKFFQNEIWYVYRSILLIQNKNFVTRLWCHNGSHEGNSLG